MSQTHHVGDPRPARTRALLFDALLELIQERRWERIRVQDILERSGVGRSTFYAHFDNKFDLLTAAIPMTIRVERTESAGLDLFPLFAHVEEMQAVVRPLMTQPLLGDITDALRRSLVESWIDHLERVGVAAERRELLGELLAGAWLGVATNWLRHNCQTPTREITDEFTTYARSVIETAKAA